MNYLLIKALKEYCRYYDSEVEYPLGSGNFSMLSEVANDLSERLISLFAVSANGHRPVHDGHPIYKEDPHFKDLVLFYEYFHGDSGRGVGASHQTGWTGLVAKLIQEVDQHKRPVPAEKKSTISS